jgi:hypothetical protein
LWFAYDDYTGKGGKLDSHLREIATAVDKSSSIDRVTLHIQYSIAVLGRRHYVSVPPVTVNNTIRVNHVSVEALTEQKFEYHHCRSSRDRIQEVHSYRDPVVNFINRHGAFQASNSRIKGQWNELNQKTSIEKAAILATVHGHSLKPECRQCYAIFTEHGLAQHLRYNPLHRIPFTQLATNPIHRYAKAGGARHACLVCGRSFEGRDSLDKHIDKERHWRDPAQGIVGKYVRDNEWFNSTELAKDKREFYAGRWC